MRIRELAEVVVVTILAPCGLLAQSAADGSPWGLRVRAVMSGSSYDSEPADYRIYSGVGLSLSVVRDLGERAAVELSFRTESREVEGPRGATADHRLGSFEMLPVDLIAQWRPRGGTGGSWQPRLGIGVNLTTTWEASGQLDSTHPPITLGPALQVGLDKSLTARAVLSLDARWTTMTVRFDNYAVPSPEVRVGPLTLGLGIGMSL